MRGSLGGGEEGRERREREEGWMGRIHGISVRNGGIKLARNWIGQYISRSQG